MLNHYPLSLTNPRGWGVRVVDHVDVIIKLKKSDPQKNDWLRSIGKRSEALINGQV